MNDNGQGIRTRGFKALFVVGAMLVSCIAELTDASEIQHAHTSVFFEETGGDHHDSGKDFSSLDKSDTSPFDGRGIAYADQGELGAGVVVSQGTVEAAARWTDTLSVKMSSGNVPSVVRMFFSLTGNMGLTNQRLNESAAFAFDAEAFLGEDTYTLNYEGSIAHPSGGPPELLQENVSENFSLDVALPDNEALMEALIDFDMQLAVAAASFSGEGDPDISDEAIEAVFADFLSTAQFVGVELLDEEGNLITSAEAGITLELQSGAPVSELLTLETQNTPEPGSILLWLAACAVAYRFRPRPSARGVTAVA